MHIESAVLELYFSKRPGSVEVIDSSREGGDIRRTYIADDGVKKLVIHEASNAFTNAGRIEAWARLREEYNRLGIYCPHVLPNLKGGISHAFTVEGREHHVYAEEFAPYETVEAVGYDKFTDEAGKPSYLDDMLRSVGKVASAHFDFCDFSSAYCLLEPFCPPETTDETTESAEKFFEFVKAELPQYYPRAEALRDLFYKCRRDVEKIYSELPVSCFQADLNVSNILTENGRFRGVIDFNLSGREPVLNYVTRLAMNCVYEKELFDEENDELYFFDERLDDVRCESIRRSLGVIGEIYEFSARERELFPVLFRYMNSFWWEHMHMIKRIKEQGSAGAEKADMLFAWLEHQMERDDIMLP